ncbi:Spy0128 family protein [Ruminococcus albus]|uniref:Pilin isopeptide linkage domain-containing protein n=1 Tax=Ruminococcus albus TaxID=1264 RepID=A0A1I1G050_RUMAL|nr:FctA domain-containing protein [Ruminococcus albus]SFC05219.1 pilin isopeptide linkage domain-containing protein [Ruminococcus albus]
MRKSTHRPQYRLLSGLLSLVCLFTVAFGSVPSVSAESAELPENIELFFSKTETAGTGEVISDDGRTADYTIEGNKQQVNVMLRLSLNKTYEAGRLEIEIPYNAFVDRDGEPFTMAAKEAFLNQLSSDTSLLKVKEDRSYSDGVIILENVTASSPHIDLNLHYSISANKVIDNSVQDYTIKIYDNVLQEDRTPETITASFHTHVRKASVYKFTEDEGVNQGCYYAWDDSLETKYHLSDLGIDEEEFKKQLKDYDFIGYRLKTSVEKNQPVITYINDMPDGGEVIAVSQAVDYSDTIPLKKETEGEYAGQWKYEGDASRFIVLVRYPKDVAEAVDAKGKPAKLRNDVTVTYVGVDGDVNDVKDDSDSITSVWQDMGAVYSGDIWSVVKKGGPDPAGAVDLLRAGKDAELSYHIEGIGMTYKYGAVDGFTYKDGPYWMEVVDDALYVNGLGDDGSDLERLKPDDFYFKTFTMEVVHKAVKSVSLNLDVKESEDLPISKRKPVEVYVMTADDPDNWQLDQEISLADGKSDYRYADANGNTVFEFKHERVYRIKFVYRDANGDINLRSDVTGVLRGEGPVVKQVLENMDKIHLGNFQVFNWDGQMGYNAAGEWENPTNGSTIYTSKNYVKQDLLDLDAELYDGHSNEAGNVKVATRLSANNNLTSIEPFCGLSKKSNGVVQEDGKIYTSYYLAAVTGRASNEKDLRQLAELGVIKGDKEIVFHELLPMGMSVIEVTPMQEKLNLSDSPKEYNWDRLWSKNSGHVEPINKEVPEVTLETVDNYKGTHRQYAKITVKYKDLPVVKLGEDGNICYSLGSVLFLKAVADYEELRSTKLDNFAEAQFIDENGRPFDLVGVKALADDGEIFEGVKDRDGNKAFEDIDGDGDTTHTNIVAAMAEDEVTMYYSATTLKKKIKADDYDLDFKDFTQTYAGHNYTYRLQFFSNEGIARNVVIYDSIEEAYKEPAYAGMPYWKGTLYGVDISEAKEEFGDVKVYVNTNKFYDEIEMATDTAQGKPGLTPDMLTEDNNWYEIDPDNYDNWAKVKTIAFKIGKDVEFGAADDMPHSVCVYLKMTAPDSIHKDQTKTDQVLAYNAPAYFCEKSVQTGWVKDTTIANVVTIGLKSAVESFPAIAKTVDGNTSDDFEAVCDFGIKPLNGAPAPKAYKDGVWGKAISTVKVAVNGGETAIGDENGSLMFTEPGVFEYEVSEKAGNKKGMTYSGEKFKVVFDVSDVRRDIQYDDNTELTVKTKVYRTHDLEGKALSEPVEVQQIEFTNEYAPAPVKAEIPAISKKIEGSARGAEKRFIFSIQPFTNFGGRQDAPAPENTRVTITGEGTAEFGKVEFTEAGQYDYAIFEVNSAYTGYTFDTRGYLLRFNVTDNDGQLVAEELPLQVLYPETRYYEPADNAEFVNEYSPTPTDTVVFPDVVKLFSGTERPDDKVFSFSISAKGDKDIPMPEVTNVTVEGAGKASFGSMTYDKVGTYVYEITEDDLDSSYVGYSKDDTVYTFTVTVTDNDSVLSATTKLTKDGEAADAAEFVNDYTPVVAELVPPVAVKEIVGNDPNEEQRVFTFELAAAEGESADTPMPVKTTATVNGSGKAEAFGAIAFTKAGTYRYVISENDLDESYTHYTKDNTVYTLTVTVKDEGGEYKAVYSIEKNGEKADELKFVNTYKPTPFETELEIEKQVEGNAPDEDEVYSFELTGKDGAPVPENTTVEIEGAGKAVFGSWTYNEAGTYVYEVSEIAGSSNNCTYDKTVFTVTDTVTDEDGVLTVSREIADGDGKSVDGAVFVNIYEDDIPTDEEDSNVPEDSSSKPEKEDDSSRGVETPENSSSATESSSSESESSSSKSDSETSSAGSSTTTQSTSNPNTGVKSLVGIEVVMLGALLCVMKKKKDDK